MAYPFKYIIPIVNNGCQGSDSVLISVDNPSLYICCDTSMQNGDTAILWADSSLHYKWEPNWGLNCDTCKEVIATPSITTTYTLTGTDAQGCTIEREITVIVESPCANFDVPNVFTPNGDGRNDLFVISANSYSIVIYDRWGKEMYKSSNPLTYWDGNTESGTKATDGVYYYIINATCQGNDYKKDGFVQLIR